MVTIRKRSTNKKVPQARKPRKLSEEQKLLKRQREQRKALAKRQAVELKEFRRKAAILKKQNLAFINVNVKSLEKSDYRTRILRGFRDTGLFEGQAHVQKVTKEEEKILKDRGYVIKNGNIILPKKAEHGERLVKKPGFKRRMIEGYDGEQGYYLRDIVSFENWEEYLNDLQDRWGYFEGNGHQLAFRLYGNLSREVYENIGMLIRKLNEYAERQNNFAKHIAEDWRETIQHIEIFKTTIPVWLKKNKARVDRQEDRYRKKRNKGKSNYSYRMEKVKSTQGKKVYQIRVKEESAKRTARRNKQKTKS